MRESLTMGSMERLAKAALVGLALLVVACSRPEAAVPPALPKVTVSRPLVREVVEWDDYTARLVAVESVEVRARVNGYLQSIHFKDGEIVRKGDLLFVIDPRPYQAELDRVTAELQHDLRARDRNSRPLCGTGDA